ncbi:MAG TPA: AAA family ATPase [Candidatus Angelobacter sp.]|nr:AAA family ATPase [Candidatus Angelobacter sp.]
MKLLGLEFKGVAGYTRQFVSFENGINLITGRNNIGKSALLRSSTVLDHLPINSEPNRPRGPLIRGYADSGIGNFRFSVLYLLNSDLDPALDQNKDRWLPLCNSKTVQLRYDFSVDVTGAILLDGVSVNVPQGEFPIIRVSKDGRALERLWYKTPLWEQTNRTAMNLSGAVVSGGRVAGTLPADDLFGPLTELTKIRLVEAHRVFRDRLELRTVNSLQGEASELGPYLQWLHGDDPRKFNQIQAFITQLFPEFEFLNVESVDNRVTIRLTRNGGNAKIPLSHCGTGVEQILALATFVVASPQGTIMLIDEPHSFLHPTAERLLLEFLRRNQQHKYVITTHSAIFINAVPASQITHLTGNGYGIAERKQYSATQLLFDLGYQNSDLLFSDRVIFIEGESDQEILPILLRKAGVSPAEIAKTGFCRMKGSGDIHTITRQSEELLAALHKEGVKRLYLFDGDQKPSTNYIKKIKTPQTGEPLPLAFLELPEIENYLLDPVAIAAAINEELSSVSESGAPSSRIEVDQVDKWLRSANTDVRAKGSKILAVVYEQAGLRFKKTVHGRLIALHTTAERNASLKGLANIFTNLFVVDSH